MIFSLMYRLLYYDYGSTHYYSSSDSADIFKVIALLIFGTGAGIYFFVTGLKKHRRLRLIENIPTSTARSVAVGLVEVKGRAAPFVPPFPSPFAGRPCVYYQYKVEERRHSGRRSYWATIAKDESRDRFYLEDETGKISVSPSGAEVDIALDRKFSSSWLGGGMPPEVRLKLEELGLYRAGLLGFGNTLRVNEAFIETGDPIYVMGTAAITRHATVPTGGETEGVIIKKGENEPFFLISDKSEKDVIGSMRLWVFGGVYGGMALCLTCAGTLVYLWANGYINL